MDHQPLPWGVTGASVYQEFLVPGMFEALTAHMVARLQPSTGTRVLDIACGTGVLSRALQRAGAEVTGLDLSPPMLEVARELSPGIEFVQGSVDSISFGDDTFDAATIQQGLQFFPDRLAALAEVRRVVQPGGRVVVACWSDPDQGGFGILADAIGRHVSESAGSMARAPFVVSDEGDLRSLFEESGYDDVSVQRETIRAHFPGPDGFADRLISAGPIVTVFDGQPPAARVAVEADITAEIQQYRQEGEIVFPMPTLIATATA